MATAYDIIIRPIITERAMDTSKPYQERRERRPRREGDFHGGDRRPGGFNRGGQGGGFNRNGQSGGYNRGGQGGGFNRGPQNGGFNRNNNFRPAGAPAARPAAPTKEGGAE